jgi:hypothetical protein
MNPIHRQSIESAWTTLLESIAEAAEDSKSNKAVISPTGRCSQPVLKLFMMPYMA